MSDKTLLDFLPEVVDIVEQQLTTDQMRWGDTWKHRPVANQERRAMQRFMDYYDQWLHAGMPIPWTKVIGEAVICIVRETHPEELDV